MVFLHLEPELTEPGRILVALNRWHLHALATDLRQVGRSSFAAEFARRQATGVRLACG